VLAVGSQTFDTFLARIIGFSSFTTTAPATAVAGYQGSCDSSAGCLLLPVTVPVTIVTCDGQNNPVPAPGNPPPTWDVTGQISLMPLCKNGPGNVGWLDWTPPGGGASELDCEIVNPNNPAIILPSWQYVSQTGNTNGGGSCTDAVTGVNYGGGVEGALRKYNGQVVLIPQFDMTCRTKNSDPDPISTKPTIETPPNYGCPNTPGGGSGVNLWYRMPSFAFFQLCDPALAGCSGREGAYVKGNNAAECDTGNGATSCLVGKFVDILSSGTVGPGNGSGTGNKALGVQLIK
jgi:hypothetical protein